MDRNWSLWRDSTGKVLLTGSEEEVKDAFIHTEASETPGDLYIEDTEGEQFAWNYRTKEWDRL